MESIWCFKLLCLSENPQKINKTFKKPYKTKHENSIFICSFDLKKPIRIHPKEKHCVRCYKESILMIYFVYVREKKQLQSVWKVLFYELYVCFFLCIVYTELFHTRNTLTMRAKLDKSLKPFSAC